MSTLTRTNSHGKKPHYKDYVSFLDSYRNAKKDDQHSVIHSDSGVNFSLSSSTNNSSWSVFSDVSDASAKKDTHEDHTVNLKNGESDTGLPPKSKTTVKTEMFIEIKSPPVSQVSYPAQVFEIKKMDNPSKSKVSVSSAAKIFEKKDETDCQSRKTSFGSLKTRQNSLNKNSIGEISKMFEGASHVKHPARRAASIGEVSKIFENGNLQQQNSTLINRPKNFNTVPKPFQPINGVPKPSAEINKTTAKPLILSPKPVLVTTAFPKFVPEPPKSYADSVDSALSSLSVSPSPPQCVSPPPERSLSPPPPPPPLPPSSFIIRTVQSVKPLQNGTASLPKASHGLPSQQITVQAPSGPQTNGHSPSSGTIDKNDPRVKKAVYGALRNMYGAYHDQANDYLATLPKNRVRKNNGLDNIIDSIASKGGLDKLTGRVIPKQEAE